MSDHPTPSNAEPFSFSMDPETPQCPTQSSRPPLSPLRELLLVSVLGCTQLLTQAALGQVLVPLHIIGAGLGTTSTGQLSWFLAAYSLTVGTFVLPAGRLGDIYGHKKMLVAGWLWFGLWSLITGLSVYAASPIFFDTCRAMQGIGPAMLLPNALAVAGTTYAPGKRKDAVFSAFACTAPIGFVVGALSSSAFAQYVWWPWTFWCSAIVCFVLAALVVVAIPPRKDESQYPTQKFDFIGAGLGVTGLVLVNFSWNQAPISGWSKDYVYIILIVGISILVLFVFYERRVEQPLLPPGTFNAGALSIMLCVGLGWSSFGIWVYYTFQVIEKLRGVSPLIAATQFIPEVLSGVAAAIATAFLLERIAPHWMQVLASVAFCVGCVLSATAPVNQTYWANTFLSMLVMAWGMDISFPASTLSLSNMVPKERQGISASLINTIVNYSSSIGLGIAGTVQSAVDPDGQDLLKGYRAALYTSVGLSGFALCVSIAFCVHASLKSGEEIRKGSVDGGCRKP